MSDLISRTDALACFHDWVDKHGNVHSGDEMVEHQRIEALPPAEPEIIRCKDCKYYYNTNPKNIPTANIICFQMHEDDYCSYAERRTDE